MHQPVVMMIPTSRFSLVVIYLSGFYLYIKWSSW